jgi:phage host-nuclease inhibitor protein Gam
LGQDINQAINNVVGSTAQQISGVKTDVSNQINSLSSDVKTKFDALSQSQQNLVAAQVQQGVDLNQAISNVATSTAQQIGGIKTDVSNQINSLSGDVKTKFDSLSQSQQAIVSAQVQQGIDLNQAINNATAQTNQNIANVKTDITQNINTVQEKFNARVDELVKQGQDYQTATQTALGELGAGVTGLQSQITAETEARQAAADEANRVSANQKAQQLVAPSSKQGSSAFGASSAAPAAAGALAASVIGGKSAFVSPLEAFSKMVQANDYVPQQQQPDGALMQSSYYSYGQPTDLNSIFGLDEETDQVEQQAKAGGLMTPLMATGGTTRYGKFAGGGLNVVHHAGKMRVDFRRGDAVTGAGDGQSDDIPAMLADGEFVIPADVVAALGNGSTKAGSDALYEMMHSIRVRARKGHPKSLPPPAKSPLDYISKRK